MTCLPVIKIPLNEVLSYNHSPFVLNFAYEEEIMKIILLMPNLVMSTINNLFFRHNDWCPPVERLILSPEQTVVFDSFFCLRYIIMCDPFQYYTYYIHYLFVHLLLREYLQPYTSVCLTIIKGSPLFEFLKHPI